MILSIFLQQKKTFHFVSPFPKNREAESLALIMICDSYNSSYNSRSLWLRQWHTLRSYTCSKKYLSHSREKQTQKIVTKDRNYIYLLQAATTTCPNMYIMAQEVDKKERKIEPCELIVSSLKQKSPVRKQAIDYKVPVGPFRRFHYLPSMT